MSDETRPDTPPSPDDARPETPAPTPPEVPTTEVPSPEVVSPEVVTPEAVTPEAGTPEAGTPEVVTPDAALPSGAAAAPADAETKASAPGAEATPAVPAVAQEPWLERWLPRWPQLLLGLCVVLILADLLHHKHGYFPIEETRLFQAWAGVLITLGLAIVGTILRGALGRPEGDDER